MTIRLLTQNLWSAIRQRSTTVRRMLPLGKHFGKAEIGKLNNRRLVDLLSQQQILHLDVSVNDTLLVAVDDSLSQRGDNAHRLRLAKLECFEGVKLIEELYKYYKKKVRKLTFPPSMSSMTIKQYFSSSQNSTNLTIFGWSNA